MFRQLKTSILLTLGLTLLLGILYPLVTTIAARLVFPEKAQGSLIWQDSVPLGSALVGQNFGSPEYFWGRLPAKDQAPSSFAASAGSNLGPLNPELKEAVARRIEALLAADPGNTAPIPVDLITSSGSGLDPHISVEAARYQMTRVANLRGLSLVQISELVDQHTEKPLLGFLGAPRVNVLLLNIALDDLE